MRVPIALRFDEGDLTPFLLPDRHNVEADPGKSPPKAP